MDVQGTRFHLIHGRADWERCTDPATGEHLGQLWREDTHTALQFDNRSGALRLTLDTPLFRKAGPMSPLDPGIRRGSGRDRYGNWYWIDEDRVSIRRRPSGDDHSSVWWSTSELSASCAEPAGQAAGQAAGGFVTCPPAPPAGVILQGLAVTTRHYLVVGYWSTPATVGGAAEQGLLLFDLHRSADPLRLLWPGDGTFRPWDLADTGDGGVLVLDRDHATYWVLDAGFRGLGHVDPDVIPLFQAADLSRPIQRLPGASRPTGFPLRTGSIPDVVDPISIEPGPDGTVMVLDSVPGAGYSRLHLYRGSTPVWTVSLQDKVEVVDPRAPDPTPTLYSVLGHDFAYLQGPPATGPLTVPMLYVADAMGKQVIAFSLDLEQKRMVAQPDFLPLRRWEGKALVRAGEGAWYDFDDRWVPLEAFTLCEFEPEGVLTTPREFDPQWPGQPFDSDLPGCEWHRLFLDAQMPSGTSITIRARAADEPGLVTQAPWVAQPNPYLRSSGAELPWYDPWPDLRASDRSLPPGTGTWELLFQGIEGRYVELELTLRGGGGSSPAIRALRAWYPRFSYRDHYLPAVFTEEDTAGAFLDRFLANFEGLYTGIEEHIEKSHLLLDARTAPPGDLQWLACWFDLVLDPQWDDRQKRFLVRWIDRFYRQRGTVPGLLASLRLFLDAEVDESLFSGACADASTSVGGVRLVERFLIRDLATTEDGPSAPVPDMPGRVRQAAHRFDVLVPGGLAADRLDMVRRIVEVGKPAHTEYELRQYWDLFVVGQARLGRDTQLGPGPSFSPTLEGQSHLGTGYLGFAYPNDISDRVVVGRDRVGDLPAL